MVEIEAIQNMSERIARAFKPDRIILFGSYAYGKPTEDSDVDLLVVMRHTGEGSRKAAEILTRVQPTFPLDLLVRTPAGLKQRLAWNDYFLREIVEKGTVLYAAPDR